MPNEKVVYESVPQKEKNAEIPVLPVHKLPTGWGVRHTQALLLFFSLTVGFTMRAQLSISIVAMTSNSTLRMLYPNISVSCLYPINGSDGNSTNVNNKYLGSNGNSTKINNNLIIDGDGERNESVQEACRHMKEDFEGWTAFRVYKWDKPTQEMILFAFYTGYTSAMLPMGILAQKYGGKITIMVCLGVNGVLSILTPWMPIFAGWLGVCLCRLFQGFTQAALYPSIHTLLGHWAPLSERGRLGAYIYTGSQFGTILAFQFGGLFAGNPTMGWPSNFWVTGVLSLICFAMLARLGAATPYEHPNISSEEFAYIVGKNSSDTKPKERRTPWKQILTCPAVWGIVVTHAGSALGYLFIFTQIPLYMSKVLKVDIKSNGLFSSLPYISMYFAVLLFGVVTDWAINKKIMSVVNVRRVSNTIGMVISTIFLAAFSFVESTTVAVILLVLCLALHSGIHTGYHINGLDLAPNFAGPMMALGNMLANLSCLSIPLMVSNIVGNDVTNQHKWQILFLAVAALQIITNTVYVVVARGDVQWWNFNDEDNDVAMKSNSGLKQKNSVKVH